MFYEKRFIWEPGEYKSAKPGFQPTLEPYIHDGDKLRAAVLVLPGGGYEFTCPNEGEPVALRFFQAGFNAFVLHYSVSPDRHPQPLLDVTRAMCIIRNNAERWHIDPDKVAVCGFSAGGHLAGSISVLSDLPELQNIAGMAPGKNKPNASILSYPVISSKEFLHQGSFLNLLGPSSTQEMWDLMSLEDRVTPDTPPTFLWHCGQDDCVPVKNAMVYADALHKNGVPVEFHMYCYGNHGISLSDKETAGETPSLKQSGTWSGLCIGWLNMLFGL